MYKNSQDTLFEQQPYCYIAYKHNCVYTIVSSNLKKLNMSNKQQLLDYYQNLCSVLNENGFRIRSGSEGEIREMEYEVDAQHPDLTAMAITDDIEAYIFLKDEGLIRKDMCQFCGNYPIDGRYTFTEPTNQITLNICEDCHPQGRKKAGGSGCMVALAMFLVFLSVLVIA